jgi:NTE family protein
MSTAFVLSGGASLGSIQAGMLEALYERGVRPDMIVGTSAGALNGAFIAERPQTVETARELADLWRGLSRGQLFPVNPLSGALGLLGARSHLVPGSGLRRLIERHSFAERIEDTAVPLHVIATDVVAGEEVRLSVGPLVDAVMASAAIPGVLPAVDWHGRALIDGGVANNTPLSHALELGADEVYVLPTGAPCELEELPHGALAMLVYGTSLLVHARLAHDVAALDDHQRGRVAVLPPPCPLSVQPMDFGHADELIERARDEARRFLDRRDRCSTARVPRRASVAARRRGRSAARGSATPCSSSR